MYLLLSLLVTRLPFVLVCFLLLLVEACFFTASFLVFTAVLSLLFADFGAAANIKYDTFYNVDNGALLSTRTRNYRGITRVGLSLIYQF